MGISKECLAVSDYIIEKVRKDNLGKTLRDTTFIYRKRLQKLLYFSEVIYMLENEGETLFPDEYFIWGSGPVIPGVYKTYFGEELHPVSNGLENKLTAKEKRAIELVLVMTKGIPTMELIDLSYGPVFASEDRYTVSKEKIYDYFLNRSLFELGPGRKPGKEKVKVKVKSNRI